MNDMYKSEAISTAFWAPFGMALYYFADRWVVDEGKVKVMIDDRKTREELKNNSEFS